MGAKTVSGKYQELLNLVYWLLESDSERHYDAALHYETRRKLARIVEDERNDQLRGVPKRDSRG